MERFLEETKCIMEDVQMTFKKYLNLIKHGKIRLSTVPFFRKIARIKRLPVRAAVVFLHAPRGGQV